MDHCAQCGFDYRSVVPAEVPSALVSAGESFRKGLLAGRGEMLRRRPEPDVWSGLEYACHMRDVLLIQRERLYLALVEDTPSFARLHRDERAELAHYNRQEAGAVAEQVVMAAHLAGAAFGDLDEGQWRRRLVYNWPDSRESDVLWLAAHTVHEGKHHLGDFETVVSGRLPRLSNLDSERREDDTEETRRH